MLLGSQKEEAQKDHPVEIELLKVAITVKLKGQRAQRTNTRTYTCATSVVRGNTAVRLDPS